MYIIQLAGSSGWSCGIALLSQSNEDRLQGNTELTLIVVSKFEKLQMGNLGKGWPLHAEACKIMVKSHV